MRWSIKIARIAGIDVYMHLTFLILLGWIAISYYLPNHSIDAAIQGVLFILAVFTTIVLHELGHALTARRYGIQTRDITLLPIGGVARLARMPDDPKQELLVAIAGPMVNVVIAILLWIGIVLTRGFTPLEQLVKEQPGVAGTFAERLFLVNVFLVVFNAIPAFPMDGGRVLRAILAMTMDYVRATHIAAIIGQGIAFLFAIVGLFAPNLILMFIALFVWMGAAAEASMAEMRAAIAGIPVRRAMIQSFTTLAPNDPLKLAAARVLEGFQHDFPIVDGGSVVGILTLSDMIGGLSTNGPEAAVRDLMHIDFGSTAPGEMLDPALSRLRESECPVMPVMDDGRLVGLLTTENVGELVMIREAVRARQETREQIGETSPRSARAYETGRGRDFPGSRSPGEVAPE
ncbi:MAG TPA: site-2 protease family protein [Gemmata sp.]|nr:site-2 protease family protein [Gemmata sp.]